MNFKKFSKGFLALALATTLALSAPMATFANVAEVSVQDQTWTNFVREVADFFAGAASNQQIVDELNKLNKDGEISQFEKLYDFLSDDAKNALNDYSLGLDSLKTIVSIISDGQDLKSTDLTADALSAKLVDKEDRIKEKLQLRGLTLQQVTTKIGLFNTITETLKSKTLDVSFLSNDAGFAVKDEAKLTTLIATIKGLLNSESLGFINNARVKEYLVKFNDNATPEMKADMGKLVGTYNLLVVTPGGGGTTPGGSGGGPGGGSTSPSKEAQKDITAGLADLTKADAKVAEITKNMLKDISKLDAVGAKAVAGPIITGMMDVIKKAENPENINDAKDAMVTLVQALVSKVTTQDVEVKDGAVTLSASKVKEQLKDAADMIKQLTVAAEKSNVELTKTVKVTLSYEFDKEVTDVAVSIPEGLWSAIDKKANIAVRAKGVELVLEHNTFAEKVYTINVAAQEGNIFELKTEAAFVQPIAVTFAVDKAVKNYPTVFQVLEGKNEVVGGVYNAQEGTIKAFLSHFSFYTVGQGEPKAFTDIRDLTWEKEAVQELSARGYIAGMSETSFAPRANITRAEFAAMLTRVVANIEVPGKVGFTDVKQGAWYYNSIVTAVNQGWLVGKENNKFDPTAPVTRQEVAAVLSRILEQKGYLQTADDAEGMNVAAWAKNAVSLYLREVETKEVLALDMSSDATRAEVAVMIYELLSK